jgi:hypothetical protein
VAQQLKDDGDKPYVLSSKDAWMLLAAASNYVHTPDRTINGKDRADIVAEAALANGHANLSRTISAIHSSIMDFYKGKHREMQFLLEGPAIREYVKDEAKGTRFEEAVRELFAHVGYIADVEEKIGDRLVDWDASSKVLLRVKKEKFPQELTMTEKLNLAQTSSSTRAK